MNNKQYAGNRFSLRNKMYNQIKRIDALSNSLGSVGDFLVSTWGGIIMGIAMLGLVGVIGGFAILTANKGATFVENIVPTILWVIGTVALTINVVMTNPSMGSQFIVSLKFIINKIANNAKRGKTEPARIFKLSEDSDDMALTISGNRIVPVAVYSIRGAISPVSFAEELKSLERLETQLLSTIERDTLITSINSIQKAEVAPIPMPANATPSMVARRNNLYKQIESLRHNQQLKTTFTVQAPTEIILRERVNLIERIFDNGLVIGYKRLSGAELKAEIKRIYD